MELVADILLVAGALGAGFYCFISDRTPCPSDVCVTSTCDAATGQCAPGAPVSCNDNNACTIDVCDAAQGGCVYTPRVCDRLDQWRPVISPSGQKEVTT